MNSGYSVDDELLHLECKIKQAEAEGMPVDNFIKREIVLLQNSLDMFLKEMESKGRREDFDIAEIEIRQYAAMKQLAQKINHPCDIYDEKIKQVQIRVFGEEGYKQFFGG